MTKVFLADSLDSRTLGGSKRKFLASVWDQFHYFGLSLTTEQLYCNVL